MRLKRFAAACLAAVLLQAAAADDPPIDYRGAPPDASRPAPAAPSLPPPSAECPPSGAATIIRLSPYALRYCGSLNAAGVEAFERELTGEDRQLVITSFGGDLDAPLRLAEIVAARGMDVEVAGPCFSGCASFVFVAGNRRVITPTGILGFHNTASSAALLGLRAISGEPPAGFAPILGRVSREWELYVARGVRFSLLYEPQVRIQTICTRPRGTHPVSGERVIDILSERDFWLPSPGALAEAGIGYEGSLPKSEREAAQRFLRYMPASAPVPKFTAEGSRLKASAESLLFELSACEPPLPPPSQKPAVARSPAQEPETKPEPEPEPTLKLRPRDPDAAESPPASPSAQPE